MTPTEVKKLRGTMTQADFAKLIGFSRQSVISWESGQRKPSRHAVQAMEAVRSALAQPEQKK